MEDDAEEEKVSLEDDVTMLDEDDVCDAMTSGVSSSYNSPDAKKQDEAAALQEREVDEEPGGNVSTRRRSPRFIFFISKPMMNICEKPGAHRKHTRGTPSWETKPNL